MTAEEKLNQIAQRLPLVLANAAVNWTLENYKRQQWNGSPWASRRKNTKKTQGRQLLVASGRMRRAIQVVPSTRGPYSAAIGVLGVPYARIHNYGGSITQAARSELFVRNRYTRGAKGKMFGGMGAFKKGTTRGKGQSYNQRTIGIPQRQFIGRSPDLMRHIQAEARKFLKNN